MRNKTFFQKTADFFINFKIGPVTPGPAFSDAAHRNVCHPVRVPERAAVLAECCKNTVDPDRAARFFIFRADGIPGSQFALECLPILAIMISVIPDQEISRGQLCRHHQTGCADNFSETVGAVYHTMSQAKRKK